jgi:hypothetical protein
MDIPQSLDAWTYDTVVTVVVKHGTEPGRCEFKASLHETEGDEKSKA